LLIAGLLVLSALAFRKSEVHPSLLLGRDGLVHVGEFLRGLIPPRLDGAFLASLVWPCVETIAIAVVGVSLAAVLALPLALFAVSPRLVPGGTSRRPGLAAAVPHALYHGSRGLLALLRSVPEVVWALLLVRTIGLGKGAGALAIAIAYTGALGKVFAEVIEGVPKPSLKALFGVGASRTLILCFGALPQALPLCVSYTFYRFDCALRSSAVLGLVGAGGLGFQLELSLKMMEYGEVATELCFLFGLVALADPIGRMVRLRLGVGAASLRKKDIESNHGTAQGAPAGRLSRWRGRALWATYLVVLLGSLEIVGLGPRDLVSALGGVGALAARAFPPDLGAAFAARVGTAVVETLAISLSGTLLGALLAVPLALLGLRRTFPLRRPLGLLVVVPARLVRDLLRSVPPLVLALVAILLVGIGPFAGVIALALHTAGVLGRLFSEVIEETLPGPGDALRALGAREAQVLLVGVLPQASPQCLAYLLYRWEVNLREAVMLGVVGAGGLGQMLHVSVSLFHEPQTLSLVACLCVVVIAVELLSSALRQELLAPRAARLRPRGTTAARA
jgi:phosphonate transport system permease protein